MNQPQAELKASLLLGAAVLANAFRYPAGPADPNDPNGAAAAQERAVCLSTERWYLFLKSLHEDETTTPSPKAPDAIAGQIIHSGPAIDQGVLQATLAAALSDPQQVAAVVAKLSPLLGLAGPKGVAAGAAVATVANSIATMPPLPPPSGSAAAGS